MRCVRLPNRVETSDIHILCRFIGGIRPVSALLDVEVPDVIADQLRTESFILTLSNLRTEFDGETWTPYRELLVKIPVTMGGEDHTYPIRTFVDHELSVVRGYQLGFDKHFSSCIPAVQDARWTFSMESLDVDVSLWDAPEAQGEAPRMAVPPVVTVIQTPDGRRRPEIHRLNVEDVHDRPDLSVGVTAGSGTGILSGHPFELVAVASSASGFTLCGSIPL
ncbi:hypothetical protein [Clavibacter capsici]|uniref:Uncharacterized protein n=1 Tax=Clavibacter capsici TaxID=1874630 RepID=A0AAE6XNK5_9MICO|nr:hypothetical protein [Clavibacter capsici]ALD12094.1 hypothetical protein AES38_03335 [Clavibacter capsici]QIS44192.1 hypothetical protein GW570_03340 [Clavibacter capsici]